MVANRAMAFTHSNMESSINRGLRKESLPGSTRAHLEPVLGIAAYEPLVKGC